MNNSSPLFTPSSSMLAVKERSDTSPPQLASRELLLEELHLKRQNRKTDGDVFLVVINIADTKAYDEIIRIFGYKFADNILSIRLEKLEFITKSMTIYQVGFWSIGIIYAPLNDEVAEKYFDTVVSHLATPIICRGIPIPIKGGVGVCDLAKGLGSTEDLLQSTYIAGQTSGRMAAGWSTCNYNLAANNRRAFSLIADIGYALSSTNEFELLYQPRMALRNGRCIAAEALLRWSHPSFGSVAPNEFIPLVEMTGLIRNMTEWVLTRAIAQAAHWHRSGSYLKVSVNISTRNLEESDFVKRVEHILSRFGLAPRYLELELSEGQTFIDPDLAISQLRVLRQTGISIAVDDFGTGSNSFTYLQTTPVTIIKIEKSFVLNMKTEPKNQATIKAMIGLAHSLGIECVAAGVETQEALLLLTNWDCDYAQGYLLARPMDASAFEKWREKNVVSL